MSAHLFPELSEGEQYAALTCWRSPYVYQLSVLSCTSLTVFLAHRNTLWIELGNTEVFWKLLKCFTAEVLACLEEEYNPERLAKQILFRQKVIQLNKPEFRQELEAVKSNTSRFVKIFH
jgi:hypothetical protein